MAIQVRRGLEKDFDPEKALPGEWLLSTDTRYIRMCITPGVVLRMATYEAFEADMAKIQAVLTECKDIQSAINSIQAIVASKAALTVEYANSAAGYAKAAATSEANAKTYAENASAVAGVGIATQDTAGLMKGGENLVDESGALVLTKTTTDTTLPNSHAGGIKLLGMYGKSVQESTTGAQLFDISGYTGTEITVDEKGWCTVTIDNTTGTGTKYVPLHTPASELLLPSTDYAVVCEVESITNAIVLMTNSSEDSNKGQFGENSSKSTTGTYVRLAKTRDSFDGCITMLRSYVSMGAGLSGSVKFRLSVIADTSITADTFKYEKFTGNAPSPSIDYPQEIKTVKGKNLLDCRGLVESTSGGVTFTPVYDEFGNLEYIEANGTATALTLYVVAERTNTPDDTTLVLNGCINGSNTTYSLCVAYYNESGNWRDETYQTNTDLRIKNDHAQYSVTILVRSGVTMNNVRFYPMIRSASVADDTYVPYGCLRIWGHGKNFLDVSNVTEYFETSKMFNVSLLPNTYTFSCANTESKRVRIYYKDGTYVDVISWNTSKVCTFTTDKVAIGILVNSNTEIDLSTWCCQLEQSTVATDYEPYQSFSHTLSQPIELNEGDCLTPQNTTRKMAEVVLDGSDDELWGLQSVNDYGIANFQMSISNASTVGVNNIISSHFAPQTTLISATKEPGILLNSQKSLFIRIPSSLASDIAEFKEWLANNNVKVLYIAEPKTEELPTADQIALNSLKSFDGITYVYCDSEIQPTWELEYGTSRVGALALENHCRENVNEIRLNELTTAMLVINQE